MKALDGVLEEGEGHAKVEEGSSKHVSADSRKAIEMEMGGGHNLG